jgi:hypothetical protein
MFGKCKSQNVVRIANVLSVRCGKMQCSVISY